MSSAVRRVAVTVVALGVLGAGGAGFWRWRNAHRKPPVEFDTANVDRGRIVARVTATGTLSALVTVQVGTQVSGTIQKLFVDFNSPVKKGQLIAKIDPQLISAVLEQARANFEAAQGNLVKAEAQERDAGRQFERSKGLLDRKLIAQADFDTAQANLDNPKIRGAAVSGTQSQIAEQQSTVAAARAEMVQAQAQLAQAQADRADLTVLAPFSGTVLTRAAEPGEVLQAGTAIVTLLDLSKVYLRGFIPEGGIGKVRVGQPAHVFLDSNPNQSLDGYVLRIDPQATFTPENTYFRDDRVKQVVGVKVQLTQGIGFAKPGMPADGEILTNGNAWPAHKRATQ